MKKKIALTTMLLLIVAYGLCRLCLDIVGWTGKPNENYLQIAKETVVPNSNFMFASNASLAGRIVMTFCDKDKEVKTCMNTVGSFFNKYHTCSSCEDFVKNPQRWGFEQVACPQIGDIVIQHNPKTDRAFHAAIIVNMENDRYYVSHAIKTKYYKNVELNNKSRLTFYRFKS